MGKIAIIVWISAGILLILGGSLIPVAFGRTWWWFFGTLIALISLGVIGSGIFLLVKMVSR